MLPGTAFSHSAIRGLHPVPIISSIDQQFRSKEHKSEWQSGKGSYFPGCAIAHTNGEGKSMICISIFAPEKGFTSPLNHGCICFNPGFMEGRHQFWTGAYSRGPSYRNDRAGFEFRLAGQTRHGSCWV